LEKGKARGNGPKNFGPANARFCRGRKLSREKIGTGKRKKNQKTKNERKVGGGKPRKPTAVKNILKITSKRGRFNPRSKKKRVERDQTNRKIPGTNTYIFMAGKPRWGGGPYTGGKGEKKKKSKWKHDKKDRCAITSWGSLENALLRLRGQNGHVVNLRNWGKKRRRGGGKGRRRRTGVQRGDRGKSDFRKKTKTINQNLSRNPTQKTKRKKLKKLFKNKDDVSGVSLLVVQFPDIRRSHSIHRRVHRGFEKAKEKKKKKKRFGRGRSDGRGKTRVCKCCIRGKLNCRQKSQSCSLVDSQKGRGSKGGG